MLSDRQRALESSEFIPSKPATPKAEIHLKNGCGLGPSEDSSKILPPKFQRFLSSLKNRTKALVKKRERNQVPVTHACNPSYLEGSRVKTNPREKVVRPYPNQWLGKVGVYLSFPATWEAEIWRSVNYRSGWQKCL
jgi:hypothetical protein